MTFLCMTPEHVIIQNPSLAPTLTRHSRWQHMLRSDWQAPGYSLQNKPFFFAFFIQIRTFFLSCGLWAAALVAPNGSPRQRLCTNILVKALIPSKKQCLVSDEVEWLKHHSAAEWSSAWRKRKKKKKSLWRRFKLQVREIRLQCRNRKCWPARHSTVRRLWCWPYGFISLSWKWP